jgi:hypothetical protein
MKTFTIKEVISKIRYRILTSNILSTKEQIKSKSYKIFNIKTKSSSMSMIKARLTELC